MNVLLETENKLLQERQNRLYRIEKITTIANICSNIAIAIAILWNVKVFENRLQRPLKKLIRVARD
jgi:hypothetical protein